MVMVVMATNLTYCIIGPVTNSNIAVRIIMFIIEIVLYGLSITMYVYIIIENHNDLTLGIIITIMTLNLLAFVLSLVSK